MIDDAERNNDAEPWKEAGYHLAMALRTAYWTMHRRADAYHSRQGVTADQFVLLSILAEEDTITQQRLAARATSDPSTVRAMLLLLEGRGFLTRKRHPSDGRARNVSLTKKGRAACRRQRELGSEPFLELLVSAFQPEEVESLIDLLRRIPPVMNDADRRSDAAHRNEAGHRLAMALRAAYWTMHRQADVLCFRQGVTADQFVLLSILAEEDTITQQRLAARATSDPSTVRAMLLLLEGRGFVTRKRHPSDGRARNISLTKKGRAAYRRVRDLASIPFRDLLVSAFQPEEMKTLTDLLLRIPPVMTAPDSHPGALPKPSAIAEAPEAE